MVARHFLETFEASEAIVVPSGSCTAMVAHHYAELFPREPETLARVHALEKKIWEFSTFLTDVAGVEDVGARFDDIVTFHDGCHALRELGIRSAPRRLLANVRGLELREMRRPKNVAGSAARSPSSSPNSPAPWRRPRSRRSCAPARVPWSRSTPVA